MRSSYLIQLRIRSIFRLMHGQYSINFGIISITNAKYQHANYFKISKYYSDIAFVLLRLAVMIHDILVYIVVTGPAFFRKYRVYSWNWSGHSPFIRNREQQFIIKLTRYQVCQQLSQCQHTGILQANCLILEVGIHLARIIGRFFSTAGHKAMPNQAFRPTRSYWMWWQVRMGIRVCPCMYQLC